jgi:serine/threonine protein kinase
MNRYIFGRTLGEGAFSTVIEATATDGETVAVKCFKRTFEAWSDCVDLREVEALRKLSHPNVVKLREVVREGHQLYLVFEHGGESLLAVQRRLDRGFREDEVRLVAYQLLSALRFLHLRGYVHRDLKPENILCDGLEVVKVSDFGLARGLPAVAHISEHTAGQYNLTPYVSTRWYRAPELLLGMEYGAAIDVWALGAILVELFVNRPLFAGSSDHDQLHKIYGLLGAPTQQTWPDGFEAMQEKNLKLTTPEPTPLRVFMPHVSANCVDLFKRMLCLDPRERISASNALEHPFFTM